MSRPPSITKSVRRKIDQAIRSNPGDSESASLYLRHQIPQLQRLRGPLPYPFSPEWLAAKERFGNEPFRFCLRCKMPRPITEFGGTGRVGAARKVCGACVKLWRDQKQKAREQARTKAINRDLDRSDVYFVQQGDGHIKIGIASDVTSRISELQTGSPVPLRLLGVMANAGRKTEAELHRRFSSLRQSGEWFRPERELLKFIAAIPKQNQALEVIHEVSVT